MIRFLLNGREVSHAPAGPAETLLDYLRLEQRLCGTKEGCGEGDCGACTVLVGRPTAGDGSASTSGKAMNYEPANACIRLMPSLHGCHVVTVEALASGDRLHPVQQAMVEHHASQCGFCTPGIVMALCAHRHSGGASDRTALETALQGNLCRCTGYAPILDAGRAALAADAPDALTEEAPHDAARLRPLAPTDRITLMGAEGTAFLPTDLDDLAQILAEHPDATLVAGATDIGVWTAKDFRSISPAVFIGHLPELTAVEPIPGGLRIGAAVSYAALLPWIDRRHPHLAAYWRRIGGPQIRAAGTIGGNLATASPIGDTAPPFITLGARIHLSGRDGRRTLPLEDFFQGYRETALTRGTFIEAVELPDPDPAAFHAAWKISKRRDEDISSLSAAFALTLSQGRVATARIAFGGMAAQPMRAQALESSLEDRPWSLTTATAAAAALTEDFEPISDMRASASYRAAVARNLVLRAWRESTGEAASLEAHAAG
ncbi:MAG: xanthine dehydrogenase small subunit [Pseudomonadota bacterium]